MQTARYDAVQKWLHWTIVALVAVQFVTKLVSPASFAGVTEAGLNAWHLAIGPTILLLMAARLAWRLTHTVPPPPDDLAEPLRLASVLTHWAFYALLLVIPILGWVAASGYGARPTLLFLFHLPQLAPADKGVGALWGAWHGWAAWALLALIGLHVAAASWHGLARDDGVFARMLPGK